METATVAEPTKALIDIDHVDQLDLRVAKILAAEPVPKAKKLLRLTVDLGTEQRQIVSGIALFYKPEELIGRQVVIIANLKPATIMGVQSQGMLLASQSGDLLELVELRQVPPGSSVS